VYWSTEFFVRDLAPKVLCSNLLRAPLDLRFQELRSAVWIHRVPPWPAPVKPFPRLCLTSETVRPMTSSFRPLTRASKCPNARAETPPSVRLPKSLPLCRMTAAFSDSHQQCS